MQIALKLENLTYFFGEQMKYYSIFLVYIFSLIIVAQSSKSDDVYLRTGITITNCLVMDTVENKVKILANGSEIFYGTDKIMHIIKKKYNPETRTEFNSYQETAEHNVNATQSNNTIQYKYPKIPLLSVALLSAIVGWDGLARVGNIQDAMDANDKISKLLKPPIDNSYLESEKTRATIIGIVGLSVALVVTIYSLEKVEIKTDGKSLSLAYSF